MRLELRSSSGDLLKYMEYSLAGTTRNSWFSAGTFLASSWSDLDANVTHDVWDMVYVLNLIFGSNDGLLPLTLRRKMPKYKT